MQSTLNTRQQLTLLASAAAVAALVVSSAAACSDDSDSSATKLGKPHQVGGVTAQTYVTTDSSGDVTALGVRLTPPDLEQLPDQLPGTMVMLDLPADVKSQPFTDVMLNWNPQGHEPPPLFGKPHFDFHFDMVDSSVLHSISPEDPAFAQKAEHLPGHKYTPADYAPMPGPPLAAQAVPGMGVHLVDAANAPVPGKYDFQHILIAGSWDGQYTFIEPMITREYLLSRSSYSEAIKQPAAYQQDGRYPSSYRIRFDSKANAHEVELSDFATRTAS
jgi:hypothetical protein